MRKLLSSTLVLAGLLALPCNLRADDRADALAIVDEAIKAHGGADALAKTQSFTRKASGTADLGKILQFKDELIVNLPDRTRLSVEFEGNIRVLLVVDGAKGWESNNGGPATAATAAKIKEMNDESYVLWLTTLLPLKKDGMTVKPLSGNNAKSGVSVSSQGRPDVKMYFDKDSHLLVKIEREAVQGGVKIDKEYQLADYKEVDGVKLPTKLTELVNRNKFSEVKAEYKLHKPDDAAFGKP
jgi:hypothetical protein